MSVSGRDYFRTVLSQNGDKLVTSPPPPIVEGVLTSTPVIEILTPFELEVLSPGPAR